MTETKNQTTGTCSHCGWSADRTYTLWLDGDNGYLHAGQYATLNAAELAGEEYVNSSTHYGTRYSVDRN